MQSREIHIDLPTQSLELREANAVLMRFPISSSARGTGTEPGSFKTPTGRFCISEKIGDGQPLGMIFKSRVPTGELGNPDNPEDLIQTRILRLHGLEESNANTMERFIYIHGTNHETQIGTPASHGCIRMRNAEIATLFDAVEPGTTVYIHS